MLFPCLIQVNNSLLQTRVFTSYWIKMVVFRMILICDVGFGLVYSMVNWEAKSFQGGPRFSGGGVCV